MNRPSVGDLLFYAGKAPLKLFDWGNAVLSVVNSFLPSNVQPLSLDNTAEEVEIAINTVTTDKKILIFTTKIDINHNYEIIPGNDPSQYLSSNDFKYQSGGMVVGSGIVLCILTIGIYLSISNTNNTSPSSLESLKKVFAIIGDIIKTYLNTAHIKL